MVFTGAWILAGLVQEGYSARREDISALAALDAESAWVMIAGLIAAGLLTLAFAAGLRAELGPGLGSSLGCGLVALTGAGLAGLGLLRNDCSSVTGACETRVELGEVSWQHSAHDIFSAPVFAAAVVAPLVLGLRFRSEPRWRRLSPLLLAAAPVLAVLFALGGVEAIPGWAGVVQRAAASVAFLCLEAMALQLLRLSWGAASRAGSNACESTS